MNNHVINLSVPLSEVLEEQRNALVSFCELKVPEKVGIFGGAGGGAGAGNLTTWSLIKMERLHKTGCKYCTVYTV